MIPPLRYGMVSDDNALPKLPARERGEQSEAEPAPESTIRFATLTPEPEIDAAPEGRYRVLPLRRNRYQPIRHFSKLNEPRLLLA